MAVEGIGDAKGGACGEGKDDLEEAADLAPAPPREFVVALCVRDPSDAGTQPRGKQRLKSGGIWYTAQSGIWQPVWMEVVPARRVLAMSSIAAIRAALQGPLSGIGDSIFWVTWRLVSAGVALPLCMSGNAFGPLLFFLLFNIPSYIVRYVLLYSSYKMGDKIITQAEENNIMSSIIRAASIVGLIMVGYMVAANVAVPLNVSMTISDQTVNILEMIDGIVPGILSLGLTYVITRLLKKRVKIIYIFLGIFVIGILGAAVNIF